MPGERTEGEEIGGCRNVGLQAWKTAASGSPRRGGGHPGRREAACTHVGVAQLVLPIGPNAGDGSRPRRLREAPRCPHAVAAAGFQAVEESGSCGKALVVSQRQLVDGGLGGLQPGAGAAVALVPRPPLESLVGRRAVAVARTRRLGGPGRPGRGSLPAKPLWWVRGVGLQRQDIRGLAVAVLARADGTAGPAPKERRTRGDA